MGLFTRKNKDKLNDKAKSNELNKPVMEQYDAPKLSDVNEVVRTTDSMNLSKQKLIAGDEAKNARILKATRDAAVRNYDLARRRITATYQDVIDSGNYVGTPFLSVQLTLLHFEKKWSVKHVEKVITTYNRGIINTLSEGKGVAISKQLVFEPIVYVNKILPASTVTPSFADLVNAFTWEELMKQLIDGHKLAASDAEIVSLYIAALQENIDQGYFVQLLDIIISRVRLNASNTIVLFSQDTLRKMNAVYSSKRNKKAKVQVSRTNIIDHYLKSEGAIKTEKEKIALDTEMKGSASFKPNDDVSDEEAEKINLERKMELDADFQDKVDEIKATEKSPENLSELSELKEAGLTDDDSVVVDTAAEETAATIEELSNDDAPLDKKAAKAKAKAEKKASKEAAAKAKEEAKVEEPKAEEPKEEKPKEEKPKEEKAKAKKEPAKPAAKKAPAKKAPAKKPAAKKAPAKKPAAKKK